MCVGGTLIWCVYCVLAYNVGGFENLCLCLYIDLKLYVFPTMNVSVLVGKFEVACIVY